MSARQMVLPMTGEDESSHSIRRMLPVVLSDGSRVSASSPGSPAKTRPDDEDAS